MIRIRNPRQWASSLVAIAVVLSSVGLAPAASNFDAVLPDDSVLYISVTNIDTLQKEGAQTRGAQLYKDPAMQPFLDGIKAEVNKLVEQVQQLIGVNVLETLSLPKGQIAFSLRVDFTKDEPVFYVYLLADVGSNSSRVQDLLNRLAGALEEQKLTRRTVGDLTVFSDDDPEPGQQLSYVVKNNVLAVGNDPDALGPVVAGLGAGSQASLANNPRFRAFRERVGGIGDIELFIDIAKILELSLTKADPQVRGALTLFGLNSFQAAGFNVKVMEGDMEAISQAALMIRGSTPIMNLFKMPQTTLAPEAWVPENIANYGSGNWDFDLFYNTVTSIINTLQPGVMANVEKGLAGPDPDNPILDLKSDLIGPLGNRISVLSDMSTSRNLPVSRFLIAWQLDDSKRLKEVVTRLVAMAGGALPLQKKVLKGNDVYTFPVGDILAGQLPDPNTPIPIGVVGFTVTDTHFMIATHVEVLDNVLNYSGPSLSENTLYQKVAAKFPQKSSSIGFTRTDEQVRSQWQLIKSGYLSTALKQALEQADDAAPYFSGFVEALNGKNLPEFEAVRQYMTPTGGYSVMDENGIYMMNYAVKP